MWLLSYQTPDNHGPLILLAVVGIAIEKCYATPIPAPILERNALEKLNHPFGNHIWLRADDETPKEMAALAAQYIREDESEVKQLDGANIIIPGVDELRRAIECEGVAASLPDVYWTGLSPSAGEERARAWAAHHWDETAKPKSENDWKFAIWSRLGEFSDISGHTMFQKVGAALHGYDNGNGVAFWFLYLMDKNFGHAYGLASQGDVVVVMDDC